MPDFVRMSNIYGREVLRSTERTVMIGGRDWFIYDVIESEGIGKVRRPSNEFVSALRPDQVAAAGWKPLFVTAETIEQAESANKVIDLMDALKRSLAAHEVAVEDLIGAPRGHHGSPELDADAAKLEALGADAGLTIEDLL